ncbi:MAG: hypothetical protein HY019_00330 [Aquabacterium sp.]|uniref:hypothetical protein n=1 Tax=Aquabacterium sp. TaxID=1872578 RepID=UPI0025BF7FB9|nr:hypothetical protein [Aquabacterium sp.]MBI3380424.1 hypothetical protein [Aquabacterium sp.]
MERIDQQQSSKKTIPAICEPQVQARPDNVTEMSACNWLDTAMAIWLRDDDTRRLTRPDHVPAPGTC